MSKGSRDQTSTTTTAPPSYLQPYLENSAQQATNLYNQGNYVAPIEQTAIGYGQNVLSGSYLNNNPYLDATFNKAAGAVTNQVQSNFGMAGRNARGADAQGLATDKYNELANQIYGGNYQAERERQQQVLPYAPQLGGLTDPGRGLDQYIGRLTGAGGNYGVGTSIQPMQSNYLGGLMGLGGIIGNIIRP